MRKLLFILILPYFSHPLLAQKNDWLVVFGTYTNGASKGVYTAQIDHKTLQMNFVDTIALKNPSFVHFDEHQHHLYAVQEEETGASVVSFEFDKKTGNSKKIAEQPTNGAHPCYVMASKKHLAVGNYTGGNFSLYHTKNGTMQAINTIAHHGIGKNLPRQDAPHVHATVFFNNGNQLLVTDLGLDKVYIYNVKNEHNVFVEDSLICSEGGGPRHLCLSKNEQYLYVVLELSGEIEVFEKKGGKYKATQLISLIKDGWKGKFSAADVHLSSDGKFLYASNRGEANEIVVFSVDKKGTLTKIQTISSGGLTPRNFSLSPDEKYIMVANQNSNLINIFNRDSKTGKLSLNPTTWIVPNPVCVQFVKNGN